ncbi:MAG: recombinase RecT [Akkermansia sp.]|nr:recombinase RecT [Akkermansia sp.]
MENNNTELAAQQPRKTMRDWIFSPTLRKELSEISGGVLNGDTAVNVIWQCVQKTPALQNCEIGTLVTACKTLAILGCMPDGIHGYLVPRSSKGTQTAIPIPSARGLVRMARSNGVKNLNVGVVRKGEPFTWSIFNGKFTFSHEPSWTNSDFNLVTSKDAESPLGYYVTWEDAEGNLHGLRMSDDEVRSIMARSDAFKRVEAKRNNPNSQPWERDSTTPWHTDYVEMAKKTVIKRAAKLWDLPQAVTEAMQATDEQEFTSMRQARGTVQDTEEHPLLAPAAVQPTNEPQQDAEDPSPELFDMPQQNNTTSYQD